MPFDPASEPVVAKVERRLRTVARALGTADPYAPSRDLFMRTFQYPADAYRDNALVPMAAPFEPSFSEAQPGKLRFTIQPLPPDAGSVDRRDESTREMRHLIRDFMGSDALYWFDRASEPFRGFANGGKLDYGAFFGSSYDRDGLYASKVFYELPGGRGAIDNLPFGLQRIVQAALQLVPGLRPLFTTLAAQREMGGQRLTFASTEPLRLADLQPVMDALGLGPPLAGDHATVRTGAGRTFRPARAQRLARFRRGPGGSGVRNLRAAVGDTRRAAQFPQPVDHGACRKAQGFGGARTLDGSLHPPGRALAGPLLDHQLPHRCSLPAARQPLSADRSSSSCRGRRCRRPCDLIPKP